MRVVSLPPLDGLAPETLAAFALALGNVYRVESVGRYGHLELLLGPEADRELGGFMNSIYIEPEHTVEVPPPADAAGEG